MALYHIQPERRNLHGQFSRELEPVLTIASGDTVEYSTLDAGWGLEAPHLDGTPRRKFEPREPEGRDGGHAMCGPIAIEGAQPGMTLAVTIETIEPGAWGWTFVGGWDHPVHKRLGTTGEEQLMVWSLDAANGVARNQLGHSVPLRPFMGVMGMPPDEAGWHSSVPPRVTGGNIDCKELILGSTLYLPIAVPGGLFSVGDGHGTQGDGEVCVTAIECPMERVRLTFNLLPELKLKTPRARTPSGWLTLGFHQDLDEANYLALEAMLELMEEQHGLSRHHALALASLTVDLHITQIANLVNGVHAFLPHGAITFPK